MFSGKLAPRTIKIFFSVASFSLALMASADAPNPGPGIGQALFEQTGANSCNHCHGITGENGKVATAAKLTHPKTWQTYKALGGDAAFKKDAVEFRKNMHEAIVSLITTGAVSHNATFKKPYFDWKKIRPYDAQMLGVTGAPSAAWLSRMKERGMTKQIAAESAYQYVQHFDKDSVFK